MIIKSQYSDPGRLWEDERYRGKTRIFLGRENAIDYGVRLGIRCGRRDRKRQYRDRELEIACS